MEKTHGIKLPSGSRKVDWPLLTLWLTYVGTAFCILYALFSQG